MKYGSVALIWVFELYIQTNKTTHYAVGCLDYYGADGSYNVHHSDEIIIRRSPGTVAKPPIQNVQRLFSLSIKILLHFPTTLTHKFLDREEHIECLTSLTNFLSKHIYRVIPIDYILLT